MVKSLALWADILHKLNKIISRVAPLSKVFSFCLLACQDLRDSRGTVLVSIGVCLGVLEFLKVGVGAYFKRIIFLV